MNTNKRTVKYINLLRIVTQKISLLFADEKRRMVEETVGLVPDILGHGRRPKRNPGGLYHVPISLQEPAVHQA